MYLISVNIGTPQPHTVARKPGLTGIYKLPSSEPIQVTVNGLAGDAICDTQNHGGPDQAVYVYGSLDYAWWSVELGRELLPGTFGENLTISELESARFNVGDYLHVGEVILQVTSPRVPCATLSKRMGDPLFVRRYRRAERPGLYCRVLQPGRVQTGDPVQWERYTGETVGVLEMYREFYAPQRTIENLRRYLAAPIAIRDRLDKETLLRELSQS